MLPGLSEEDARDLLLSVGTHHGKRRLSPSEVGELFHKAITAGASLQDCARFVNLAGPTMVTRFVRLLRLLPDVRDLVDWGQTGATLAFASAWELAELDQTDQEFAAREVMANQLKKEEVRQLVQLRERSGREISECLAEVLRMRPRVERLHVFIGAVNEELRQSIGRLRQSERDGLLKATLQEVYGPLPKTSGRLGTERFTILTDEHGAARLGRDKEYPFEAAINAALLTKAPKV